VRDRYASVQRKWSAAAKEDRIQQFRRPKYLFSGLTKCGECGAGFIVHSREFLGCFGARDRGTCSNRLRISRLEVESRVLNALQTKLRRKDFFEEFCREFAKEMLIDSIVLIPEKGQLRIDRRGNPGRNAGRCPTNEKVAGNWRLGRAGKDGCGGAQLPASIGWEVAA
jgi:hypothetical protein